MTNSKINIGELSEKEFNNLPFLPPKKEKVETVKVLKQLVKSSFNNFLRSDRLFFLFEKN